MVSKWVNLLKNGVYWGYNPFTNHLLTSWDIQVDSGFTDFLFSPRAGKMIEFNEHIFKMGGSTIN